MDLEESQAKASTEFEGKTYYFCSDACREEFEAGPEQYALGAGPQEGDDALPFQTSTSWWVSGLFTKRPPRLDT